MQRSADDPASVPISSLHADVDLVHLPRCCSRAVRATLAHCYQYPAVRMSRRRKDEEGKRRRRRRRTPVHCAHAPVGGSKSNYIRNDKSNYIMRKKENAVIH